MIIIDDFIKDKSLLEQIARDNTFFNNNGQYFWYDGWWNQKPNTLKKKLIEQIWGENSPYDNVNIEGFEYWTGQLGEGLPYKELPVHIDKDEEAFAKDPNKIIAPTIGTVFYPVPMTISGGDLKIFPDGKTKKPDVVRAKFNRLIIFPAGEHHHQVTSVYKGVRSAIAINLWEKKPSGNLLTEG
tara:strand:- start:1155 stop:1706 length:552 start_codon:yes stop_codon:yes gene_type:complete